MLGIISYGRCPFCDADLRFSGGVEFAVDHLVDCTKREAETKALVERLRESHPDIAEEIDVEATEERGQASQKAS